MEGMMEWVKQVMIVFDTKENREFLGAHNDKYQAVELRLRSDGKCFYVSKHSKVTLDALYVLDAGDKRWDRYLNENSDRASITEDQFMAFAESHRRGMDGAYL
jgi:hypothetical protein